MNIALGFGSTEQTFVRGEEDAIREQIEALFVAEGRGYFTDDLTALLRNWLLIRSEELHADAATYKRSPEYPDRYSYYWPTVLDDASHIVVILKIHHINRRHGLSPDGWGLMRERAVFVFDALDISDASAGTAETTEIGSVHEHATGEAGDAQ